MSWRGFVSRNCAAVRVWVDPTQIAPGQRSHGLLKWYKTNYDTLRTLNPLMPLQVRGIKGCPTKIQVEYGTCCVKMTGELCCAWLELASLLDCQLRQSTAATHYTLAACPGPLPADFGNTKWWDAEGLEPAEVDKLLAEAVHLGDYMPRSRTQSFTAAPVPLVVD